MKESLCVVQASRAQASLTKGKARQVGYVKHKTVYFAKQICLFKLFPFTTMFLNGSQPSFQVSRVL